MPDGISNYSINAGALGGPTAACAKAPAEAVDRLQGIERKLAGRGGLSDGRVCQSAALKKRQDACGQSVIAHRDHNDIVPPARESEESSRIGERLAGRRNLYGVPATTIQTPNERRKVRRRAAEIMRGDQQASRGEGFPQLTGPQLLGDFQLDVAPLASGTSRLGEDGKLGGDASGKFAAAATAAAGRDEGNATREMRKPLKKSGAIGGTAQVIQAQLDYANSIPGGSGPELAFGLGGGWRGYHAADAVWPEHGDD